MSNLNDRYFRTAANNQGLSSGDTTFHYQQQGEIITGQYSGGHIKEGHIIGKQTGTDQIELLYHCITIEGQLLAGDSKGTLSTNDQGKIEMHFDWQWLNGDRTNGKSHYVEIDK